MRLMYEIVKKTNLYPQLNFLFDQLPPLNEVALCFEFALCSKVDLKMDLGGLEPESLKSPSLHSAT